MASHLARLTTATLLFAAAPAQSPPDEYWMSVAVDPVARTLRGDQTIGWTNRGGAPASELRFHLYLNAFRDLRSTFMQEAGPEFRALWRPQDFGSIRVAALSVERGGDRRDLIGATRHVQPDDGNPDDATVLAVALPWEVAAGERLQIRTRFEVLLPKAHRRTGWIPGGGLYAMHWFPKLGVLRAGAGGDAVWHCHQFHANTEFFADFATYDVAIELPRDWVVGATGGLGAEVEGAVADPTRKLVRFRQTDVHDFAFVADPRFRLHRRTWHPTPAILALEPDAKPVELLLLLHPEHDTPAQVQRHFGAVDCGLAFFGERYGAYPYPALTVVDAGSDVFGRGYGGGMEYPTLITCGTPLWPHPRELAPEGVAVHEFGHQYWYGLVANDESREAWLDEGIDSYSENRALQLGYGARMQPVRVTRFGLLPLAGVTGPLEPGIGLLAADRVPGLGLLRASWRQELAERHFRATLIPDSPLLELLALQPTATQLREVRHDPQWQDRTRMLATDNPDPLVLPGWQYASRASYVANSYSRPATLLVTLERMTGRTRWWQFLREFHQQSRLRHATTDAFRALLAERCGPAVADFFTRAGEPMARFDYGVESVEPADGEGARKTVVVRRHGNLQADVRVRFRFAGREPIERAIPAGEAGPRWVFEFENGVNGQDYGRLVEVWVDPPGSDAAGESPEAATGPAGIYLIDANLLNNAWRSAPNRGPARQRAIRLLLQAQSQLSFAGLAG
jgi:hypothetical protein